MIQAFCIVGRVIQPQMPETVSKLSRLKYLDEDGLNWKQQILLLDISTTTSSIMLSL